MKPYCQLISPSSRIYFLQLLIENFFILLFFFFYDALHCKRNLFYNLWPNSDKPVLFYVHRQVVKFVFFSPKRLHCLFCVVIWYLLRIAKPIFLMKWQLCLQVGDCTLGRVSGGFVSAKVTLLFCYSFHALNSIIKCCSFLLSYFIVFSRKIKFNQGLWFERVVTSGKRDCEVETMIHV